VEASVRNGHLQFQQFQRAGGAPGTQTQNFGGSDFAQDLIFFSADPGDGVGTGTCTENQYCATVEISNYSGLELDDLFTEITGYQNIVPPTEAISWAGSPFTYSQAYASVFANPSHIEAAFYGDLDLDQTKSTEWKFNVGMSEGFSFTSAVLAFVPHRGYAGITNLTRGSSAMIGEVGIVRGLQTGTGFSNNAALPTSSSSHPVEFVRSLDAGPPAPGPVCKSATLTGSPSGTVAAWIPVTLNATALCSDGAVPNYRFAYAPAGTTNYTYLSAWSTQPFVGMQTTNVPPGDYDIVVFVRASGSSADFDAMQTLRYTFVARCTGGASVTETPSAGGAVLTLQAHANCTAPQFQYFYRPMYEPPWIPIGDGNWTTGPVTWDGTMLAHGRYEIFVVVRELTFGNGDGGGGTTYQLGTGCTGLNAITASPTSPRPAGTSVTFTTLAHCTGGETPEYAFFYIAPNASVFTPFPAAGFQAQPSATLNTTGLAPGTYLIQAWTRGVGHAGDLEALASVNFVVSGPCVASCANKQCGDSLSDGCGHTCPGACGVGSVGCNADSDCPLGTLCSGRTPGSTSLNVCQIPSCLADPVATGCGFPGAPCGPSCATKPTCSTNSDCASGYVCGNGNGFRYGAPGANVCELPSCQTTPVQTGCGNIASECGLCSCTPSCTGKTCGDSSDGCGFTCPGVCVDREAGCTSDTDCGSGSVCVLGAGARVGLSAGANVCLPAACRDSIISRIPCGDLNSVCGECPTPPANVCDGLACGTDPTFGVACGSACADGTTCIANQCVTTRIDSENTIDSLFGPPPGTPFSLTPLPFLLSDTVGSVPGTFEVTDRGAAHYSIPITVPPGRAGLEPKLSIDYTNAKDNGYLGVGWSVTGLSAISTCARTLAVDSEARSIKDDGLDPYCLDGQRLIEVGADEFRTEIDSFSKIVLSEGATLGAGGSPTDPDQPPIALPGAPIEPRPRFPAEWIVSDREGRILHFTPTVWHSVSGERVTRTWGLTEIDDRNGNSVVITYQEVPQNADSCQASGDSPGCEIVEAVPAKIDYGINSALGGVPDREVSFHFTDDRPDRIYGFGENGLDIQRTRLLDKLQTFVDGKLVRTYSLRYDLSPTTQSERLTGVQECAIDATGQAESCKAPTSFAYDEAPPSVTSSIAVQDELVQLGVEPTVLDWNGDGADDLMFEFGSVLLSDKHGGFVSAPDSPRRILAPDDQPILINASSAFDFDQDGDDDVFDFEPRPDAVTKAFSPAVANYRVYLAGTINANAPSSTPPFTTVTLALPAGLAIEDAMGEARSAKLLDVDGDGLKDLFLCRGGWGNPDPRIFTVAYYPGIGGAGGGFGERIDLPLPPVDPIEGCDAPASSMDVDGDGHDELVFGAQALHIDATATPTWTVLQRETKDIVVSSLFSIFADINGDGLKDFIENDNFAQNAATGLGFGFWVSLNRGGTFSAPVAQLVGGTGPGYMSNIRVADVNGDHCDDLVLVTPSAGPGSPTVTEIWYGDHSGLLRQGNPTLVPLGQSLTAPTPAAIGDFNGDDSSALVTADADGTTLLLQSFHSSFQDLLSTVTDGNGQQIQVTYDAHAYNPQFISSSPQLIVPCNWPALCDHSAGMVVSESVVSGGTRTGDQFGNFQNLSTEQYQYVRARHGVNGRSSLGFESRSVVHLDGQGHFIKRTDLTFDNSTYLRQSAGFPLFATAGRVTADEELTAMAQSELEDHPAALHSRIDNVWTVQDSAAGRPVAVLASRDSQNADDNAPLTDQPELIVTGSTNFRLIRTRETFVTDGYGNVTHEDRREQWTQPTLTDVYNSYNVIDTTFDLSQTRLDAWLVSKPLHKTETNSFFQDQKTRETDYAFDTQGNLQHVFEDQNDCSVGRFTYTTPDMFGNVTDIVTSKPDGCDDEGDVRTVHLDFDDHKLFPERVVNSLGQATQVRYDSRTGDLLSSVDPNGLATQLAYDAFGRLLQRVTPAATDTRRYQAVTPPTDAQFDVRSVVRVIQDSSTGAHSERDLDAFGRDVRTATLGLDGKTVQTERAYTLAGLLDLETRPHLPGDFSQGAIVYSYDARQRLSTVTAADGSTTRYAYASASNCRADICPTEPNPTVATTPDQRVLREFNVKGVFSPRDNSLTLTYLDHRNQPLRVIDGATKQTAYRYGAAGTLLQTTDAEGHGTTIQYDSHLRPTVLNDPDKGIEGYSYTAFDELENLTAADATPHTRAIHRDTLGRVIKISDSIDGDTRFCFDAACDGTPAANDSLALTNQVGRLVESISPSNIHTRYEFEPVPISGNTLAGANRGFLKAIHRTIPQSLTGESSDEEFTTQYSYNDRNLLSQIQYPASAGTGFAVGYSYDGAGNLNSVFNPTAAVQDPRGTFWQPTNDFQGLAYANEQFGDGTQTTSTYENLTGRLQHLETAAVSPTQAPTPLLDLGFTYYADGLVETANRQLAVPGEHRQEQYFYDALGRVTTRAASIANPNVGLSESETSVYSDSGNITFRSGTGDYTYDPTNTHRVTHVSGIDFDYYTNNGDVHTRSGAGVVGGQQEFEYTGFHLPKRVLIGGGSSPSEVDFDYDANEQRALKTSALGQRLYAGDYERFSPSIGGPKAFAGETREHIYKVFGPSGLIAQVIRGESGGQVSGEATLYIHSDEQGSPALIRDDAGVTHSTPRWTTSGAADGAATWESTDDPLARTVRTTYTGHEFDEELGLTNMQGRIFDQSVGRFMQPDPVVQVPYNSQGLNRYSYALNSPLNLVDPSGFDFVSQTPDGGKMTTLDVTEVCGGAGCDGGGAGAGEHSHGQGSSHASPNQGASSGSASPTTNSANGGGGDPTGGDKAHPPSGGPPSQTGQAQAQAAQTQQAAGNNGDFRPGNAQSQAGMAPGKPTEQPSARQVVGTLLWPAGGIFLAHLGSLVGRAIGQGYANVHPADDVRVDRTLGTVADDYGHSRDAFGNPAERPDIFNPTTGAVYEIKPRGAEALAAAEAEYYVAQLRAAGFTNAHLGDSDDVGTTGAFDVWGFHINYSSPAAGVITYGRTFNGVNVGALSGIGAAAASAVGSLLQLAPAVP
jgi:RHS repeat-associated protein